MMLGCLKGISGFGAFVILIVGLGMTGITIYGFTHSQIFLNDTKQRQTILGVLIAADLIIVLGSIMGIYGLKKNNSCLICIFQVLVLLFLVIFFSLGIAAEVMPSKFFSGTCDNADNPTLALAYSVNNKANTTFCKLACQCNLIQATKNLFNITEQIDLLRIAPNTNETGGVLSWQSCANQILVLNITQEERDMGTALGAIEDLFECAGWCDNNPPNNFIYRFSNINKGRPQGYCYTKLKDAVNKYANVIGAGALITAGFLLLVTLINLCICCHPSRRKLSFKDRFVYMKDGEYSRI